MSTELTDNPGGRPRFEVSREWEITVSDSIEESFVECIDNGLGLGFISVPEEELQAYADTLLGPIHYGPVGNFGSDYAYRSISGITEIAKNPTTLKIFEEVQGALNQSFEGHQWSLAQAYTHKYAIGRSGADAHYDYRFNAMTPANPMFLTIGVNLSGSGMLGFWSPDKFYETSDTPEVGVRVSRGVVTSFRGNALDDKNFGLYHKPDMTSLDTPRAVLLMDFKCTTLLDALQSCALNDVKLES